MARTSVRSRALRIGVPLVASTALVAALTTAPAFAGPTPLPSGSLNASAQPAPVVPMNYAINAFEIKDGDWEGRTFQKSTRAVRRAVLAEGGDILVAYPKIGVVIAQAEDEDFIDAMRSDEHADVVESIGATRTSPTSLPNLERKAEMFPRVQLEPDPREGEQWGNTELRSLAANEIEAGAGVRVGVLDSGMDLDHPDLAANIDVESSATCTDNGVLNVDGGSYTNSAHGTHVAGTIGAPRNGVGVAGIAPEVELVSINVVNDDGFIFPEYAICGFMYAPKVDVDVTNNSYYIDPWMYWCPEDIDQSAVLESVGRAIEWTHKKHIVNVAAAGNDSHDLANKSTDSSSPNDSEPIEDRPIDGCSDIPTELPGVVTVSATTQAGPKSSFSNYGDGVIDVSGPGSSILSTVPDGGYSSFSGTSMASPHVAGVVALIKAQNPDASIKQIMKILEDTAEDRACGGASGCTGTAAYNGFFGHGVVDALAAVS